MRWSILLALLAAGCSGPSESKKAETPAQPVFFRPDPASAATITGKVSFAGRKPAPKPINMAAEEAECLRLHKSKPVEQDVLVNDNGTLANVFVYVKTGLEGKVFPPPESKVRIDQTGCNFVPRVFGMRAGQALEVVNSDPVSHNIHPLPKNNREWNQQQAPGAEPLEREFARAEVMIPVKCNIHSWMKSWIGVTDHPYFAVTGPEGAFELLSLPPGEYTVEAWHEVFGSQQQKVKLAPSASASIEFSFQ
jgi:plastocyanin